MPGPNTARCSAFISSWLGSALTPAQPQTISPRPCRCPLGDGRKPARGNLRAGASLATPLNRPVRVQFGPTRRIGEDRHARPPAPSDVVGLLWPKVSPGDPAHHAENPAAEIGYVSLARKRELAPVAAAMAKALTVSARTQVASETARSKTGQQPDAKPVDASAPPASGLAPAGKWPVISRQNGFVLEAACLLGIVDYVASHAEPHVEPEGINREKEAGHGAKV